MSLIENSAASNRARMGRAMTIYERMEGRISELNKRIAKLERLLGKDEEASAGIYPTMRMILEETAKLYGVTQLDLRSHRRNRAITRPRHVVMYLGRTLTPVSFSTIARSLSGRDHTTVMHGWRNIEAKIKTDDDLRRQILTIEARLNGRLVREKQEVSRAA